MIISKITIFTATFNRGYCIHLPFESLLKQTNKNFEWVVIDDGSTDNTKEIIDNFRLMADFPIIYYKQINAGKGACWNKACELANTNFIIDLDSDDEFVPEAVERIIGCWDKITDNDYSRFACVVGQCIGSDTKHIVGGTWPDGINTLKSKKQHKLITKFKKGRNLVVGV